MTKGSTKRLYTNSKNNWIATADETLKRTTLFLKSVLSETEYKTYLPNGRVSIKKDIDRLSIFKRIMTTSELRGHRDLADRINNINELIRVGDEIFKKNSITKSETKEEVQKLITSKEKWLDQLQKLKYLYRGYFHGTKTGYSMFFKDMSEMKPRGVKGNVPEEPAKTQNN